MTRWKMIVLYPEEQAGRFGILIARRQSKSWAHVHTLDLWAQSRSAGLFEAARSRTGALCLMNADLASKDDSFLTCIRHQSDLDLKPVQLTSFLNSVTLLNLSYSSL